MSATSTQTVSQSQQHTLSVPVNGTVEGKLYTIDDIVRHNASQPEDFPVVGYPVTGCTDFEEHTARQLNTYATAGALKLKELGLPVADSTQKAAPVAAILSASSFNVVVTMLGLLRLGYTVFFLSTRLTAPAYVRLLESGDCSIVVSTEAFALVLDEVNLERKITRLPLLERSNYIGVTTPEFQREYDPESETKKNAMIIHSSGSTGHPKPIWISHATCLANFPKNFGMRALTTSPLFHSHGLYELWRSIYSKKILFLNSYSMPLTRQNLMATLQYVKPELFHCVPYVLKLLCETQEGIDELVKCKKVLYAGSGCPEDLGDRLVAAGVNLAGNYGATETGRLMTSFRPRGDNDWNYLRLEPPISQYVLMDKIAEGVYECVALDGLGSKTATNSDNPPNSFRTKDLFAPHPTKPNAWKYLSRLDDRLTLMNGEKVLPLPIEGRIRQEHLVKEAAVFGAGRTVPGLLVFRADEAASMSDEEYFNAIWPAVEAANARAETFSRIPRELVVVLPADTSYPRTDKGTFIRAQLYDLFQSTIEEAYDRFENGQSGTLALDIPELEQFLLTLFESDLKAKLSINSDFYQAGIDSLQCTRMWSTIKKKLDLGGKQSELSQNVLYETANVAALARHLYHLRTGEGDVVQDETAAMAQLIEKYSRFSKHEPSEVQRSDKQVVLLTGATGTLGAHVLAQLIAQPNVFAVWTLVRASSNEEAHQRVSSALDSRQLSSDLKQRSKIIAFPGDLSRADLGLSEDVISRLKSNLTTVIHSAWAVNFNLGVKSFEEQHIKGVHNLIQLCLSTKTSEPAKFFFCSSVSAAGGTPLPAAIKEGPVDNLSYAQNTGYGRSKLVSEHIARNAMQQTGICARVLRLGQIGGDSVNGDWNPTEAIPLMIQSATTTKTLPALNEEYSWLPVDYAARIMLDLTGITTSIHPSRLTDADLVYNVQNPQTFHWTNDLLPALERAGLSFKIVPPKQWIEALRNSEQDPEKNPPVKLTGFFAERYGNADGKEVRSAGRYETVLTRKDSETMNRIPDLVQEGLVEKYVQAWRRRW